MKIGGQMEILVDHKNDIAVVKVSTEIANIELVSQFKDKIFSEIDNGMKKFLIDFSQTVLIDSTFLGSIVVAHKKVKPQAGEIKICCLSESVSLSFGLSKLNTIFKIYDDVDSALNDFN